MTFIPPGDEPNQAPPTAPPAPPVPGWWLASDGNWYPPQAAQGAAPPITPPPYGAPAPYGAYPSAQYGYTPYAQPRGTNGMDVASKVLGILWVYWIGSILAIIFGFIALSQIKERNQQGRGMAIAGLILGFIGVGTLVLILLVVILGDNAQIRFSSVGNSIN
jgi:hypothetical protein